MTAFRETVIPGLLQADALKLTTSPLLMSHPLGIATIWILTMIQIGSDGRERMGQNGRKVAQEGICYS